MMRSENPFLAIAAIRALSDSKYLAAKLPDIFSRLSGMNSTQQAVFICYLLSATDTEAGAESLTRLKAIIAEEPDLEKLKAIVLGAAVAEQGPPTAIQRGLKIMSIIRRNRGTGLPVTETDRLVDHFIRSDDSRLNAVGP